MARKLQAFIEEARAKGFITAEEAAIRAGTPAATICRWVREGKVLGEKSGKILLIARESLKAFVGTAFNDGPIDGNSDKTEEGRA